MFKGHGVKKLKLGYKKMKKKKSKLRIYTEEPEDFRTIDGRLMAILVSSNTM